MGNDAEAETTEETPYGKWQVSCLRGFVLVLILAFAALFASAVIGGAQAGNSKQTNTSQGTIIEKQAEERSKFSALSDPEKIMRNKGCCIIVDNETGVEYIVISGPYRMSMSPRYNADGTLMVYEGQN